MKTLRMITKGLMVLTCMAGLTACGDDDNNSPSIPDSPSTELTSATITPKVTVSGDLLDYATVQVYDSISGTTTTIEKSACSKIVQKDNNVSYEYYEYKLPSATYTKFPVAKHAYRIFATVKNDSLPEGVEKAVIYLKGGAETSSKGDMGLNTLFSASRTEVDRTTWKAKVTNLCSNVWLYYSISDGTFSGVSRVVTPPTNLSSLTLHPGICLNKDVLTYSDVQIYDSLTGNTTDITLDKCKAISTAKSSYAQKDFKTYFDATGDTQVYLYELPVETHTVFPVARHGYSLNFKAKAETLPAGVEKASIFVYALLDYEYEGTLSSDRFRAYAKGKTNILAKDWKTSFDKNTKGIFFWYTCDSKGLRGRLSQN